MLIWLSDAAAGHTGPIYLRFLFSFQPPSQHSDILFPIDLM